MRIVIIEDNKSLASGIAHRLRDRGYGVDVLHDGADGDAFLASEGADLVILDINLPGLDGLEILRRVRQRGDPTPVIMLTARTDTSDRVEGLDTGADDYLVKPFASKELSARVRALLRRTSTTANDTRLVAGPLTIDRDTRSVARAGRNIELTKTEFNLLELLAEQCDIVVSRDFIYEHVWGYNFETSSKSLDVYVGYLRRKINAPGESDLIRTVRGVGYSLVTK